MDRRQFLVTTGTASTVALAGCLGSDDTDSPEAVVRAYLEVSYGDGDPDELSALLHSDSPLEPDAADGSADGSVTIDSVTVEEENLDGDAIRSLNLEYGADENGTVAAEENALVEAVYDITAGLSSDTNAGGRQTIRNRYLTAEEDGDWLLVDFERL